MKIETFQHARKRLDELAEGINEIRQFFEFTDSALSAVNALKRELPLRPPPPRLPPPPPAAEPMPEAWTHRVIVIFKEAGRPLTQKQTADLYTLKGWERPEDDRVFYTRISGAIAYLTKRKGTVEKTPEGYRLK